MQNNLLRRKPTPNSWSVLIVSVMLSFMLTLSGCSPLPVETLDELLVATNAAHQAIDNDGLRGRFALRQPVDESGELVSTSERYSYYTTDPEPYDPDLVLTQEQLIEDVTYLFDALYTCYGNYDRMGGQAAFDAAEQDILEECVQYSSLRAEEFQKLLVPHFAFVKDAHFQIQNQAPNSFRYPFFFREVAFYEDNGQYITADRKTVASVDGYDDLSRLFKRSISPEGEIVYYPVLLKDSTTCDEILTVHYTDGSTRVLQSNPCDYSERLQRFLSMEQYVISKLTYKKGIPVLRVNSMQSGSDSSWKETFLGGAKTLGNSKISVLDLRLNPGGTYTMLEEWFKAYAKAQVPANSIFRDAFTGEQLFSARDTWVENDNLLIVLTSKLTASGAEWLIDAAYNLENVLIVGENTYGALIGSSSEVQMKNSKIVIKIGNLENIVPSANDYFEEFRGFYPDLWVPANEADSLIIKFLVNCTNCTNG